MTDVRIFVRDSHVFGERRRFVRCDVFVGRGHARGILRVTRLLWGRAARGGRGFGRGGTGRRSRARGCRRLRGGRRVERIGGWFSEENRLADDRQRVLAVLGVELEDPLGLGVVGDGFVRGGGFV